MATKKVETGAAVSLAPWAGMGGAVSSKLSPEQLLVAAKVDWTVSKRPMAYQNSNGVWVPSKTDFALVRDSDEVQLTTVGTTYKPVQNSEAMDFFKKFTASGHMNMEHAGSLAGGRYIWTLARINADFTIGKDDRVMSYLLFIQPHLHGKAMVIQYMSIREWCWNTLGRLLKGNGLRGSQQHFRMAHSRKFDDVAKAEAEQVLGLGVEQANEMKAIAQQLAKKKAKPEQVEEFFCEVLRYDPKKADKDKREPNKLPQFRTALLSAPGQQAPTAMGTWWGAVNAVTYVIDHETGRERATSLRNAWLGHTAGIKRHALDLAIKKAA